MGVKKNQNYKTHRRPGLDGVIGPRIPVRRAHPPAAPPAKTLSTLTHPSVALLLNNSNLQLFPLPLLVRFLPRPRGRRVKPKQQQQQQQQRRRKRSSTSASTTPPPSTPSHVGSAPHQKSPPLPLPRILLLQQ